MLIHVDVHIGYPISSCAIRPFAESDLTVDAQTARVRTEWNEAFSTERVVVEHAFGQLKLRFPSLRTMPGWNLSRIYRAIEALLIIHNICVDRRDVLPLEYEELVIPDRAREIHQPIAESHNNLRACGLARRKQLVEYWEHNRRQ
jgi:hypothetical protein